MKRKITRAMKNHPGIYRILIEDLESKKLFEPSRGKKFGIKIRGRRKTFLTFQEAKEFRAKLSGAPSIEIDRTNAEISFEELVGHWLRDFLPHKEVSTQNRYRSYLKHFEYLRSFKVSRITPSDIDRLIGIWKSKEYLSSSNETRQSYDHEFSVLRGLFNFYVTRFDRNFRIPIIKDHMKMLKVCEKQRVEKDLTLDEFKNFLSALKDICISDFEEPYYIAQMQYGIFGRVQEAAAICYEDFDFTNEVVHIRRKAIWPRGGGIKSFFADGAKSNSGKTIALSSVAKRVFYEWTLKRGIRKGPLFSINGDPISYRKIEYRYTKALKLAGIDFSGTHLLRHASLSEFYEVSGDIMATKKVAGHSDLKSTQRYAKARDKRIREHQSKFDARVASVLAD